MRVALLLCCALLAGCATGYGKSNIFGGYWSKNGPGELIEVGFNGNGYTKIDNVKVYLLYRSAEIALQRGKPCMSVYDSIFDAILDRPSDEASASALGGKPFGKVYMLTQDSCVPGALSADTVLAKYAAQVKGQKPAAPTGGAQ